MNITIRHDQNSIDPSATYTEEQFAQVRESLEREYARAILAEYPDAEIEFEESTDPKSIVVKTSGLDDPSEIEDDIQRITETVFEKICADEVLRLKQVSGLAEMFADREFSEAWEIN